MKKVYLVGRASFMLGQPLTQRGSLQRLDWDKDRR